MYVCVCVCRDTRTGPLDLSSLLRPGTFLNALRQQTARASQVPLDELRLATCWDVSKLGPNAVQVSVLCMLLFAMCLCEFACVCGARMPAMQTRARARVHTQAFTPHMSRELGM